MVVRECVISPLPYSVLTILHLTLVEIWLYVRRYGCARVCDLSSAPQCTDYFTLDSCGNMAVGKEVWLCLSVWSLLCPTVYWLFYTWLLWKYGCRWGGMVVRECVWSLLCPTVYWLFYTWLLWKYGCRWGGMVCARVCDLSSALQCTDYFTLDSCGNMAVGEEVWLCLSVWSLLWHTVYWLFTLDSCGNMAVGEEVWLCASVWSLLWHTVFSAGNWSSIWSLKHVSTFNRQLKHTQRNVKC